MKNTIFEGVATALVTPMNEDGTVKIDETMCNACGLCKTLCKFDAIEEVAK